jgi:hypothetical protein
MRAHHWAVGGITLVSVVVFYVMLFKSLGFAEKRVSPRLLEIEQSGPS